MELPSTLKNNDSSLHCKELLLASLSPMISIISSSTTNEFINKNYKFNKGFYELIRPFGENLKSSFNIKNTQLITTTYRQFSVRFCEGIIDVLKNQKDEHESNKKKTKGVNIIDETNRYEVFKINELNDLMNKYIQTCDGEIKELLIDKSKNEQKIRLIKESIYLQFISRIYSSKKIVPFETFNHPIIHLIILTSNDNSDSINEILNKNQLNRKKHLLINNQMKEEKFPIPGFIGLHNDDESLICFLILNDLNKNDEDKKCEDLKDYVKKNYYYPCLSLKLDGSDTNELVKNEFDELINPGIYKSIEEELIRDGNSQENLNISKNDQKNITSMLTELIKLNLIPFMEKKITLWDDVYIQPRKSITNRFFSASKRYFSSSTPTLSSTLNNSLLNSTLNNNQLPGYDPIEGYYTYNSQEAIIRKLADWSFMLKDYKYANSIYELVKKDFNNDKTWVYFASCQEFSSISLILDLINYQTSSSLNYFKSIKNKLDQLLQNIDNVNYTYLHRCNLKSFSLKYQLTISELFNCLKINLEINSANHNNNHLINNSSNHNNNLINNSLYSINSLNDILTSNLLIYNKDQSYHSIKALILGRISYSYSIFLYNYYKYSLLVYKKLIDNESGIINNSYAKEEKIKTFPIFEKNNDNSLTNEDLLKNPYKLIKKNLSIIGLTRFRKSGFWLLLSINQWDHLNDPIQLKLNIEDSLKMIYGFDNENNELVWLKRIDGLLGKFIKICQENENLDDNLQQITIT